MEAPQSQSGTGNISFPLPSTTYYPTAPYPSSWAGTGSPSQGASSGTASQPIISPSTDRTISAIPSGFSTSGYQSSRHSQSSRPSGTASHSNVVHPSSRTGYSHSILPSGTEFSHSIAPSGFNSNPINRHMSPRIHKSSHFQVLDQR